MNQFVKQLKNGVIYENPTFIQLLGMCPTLAVTTSVTNALGMGVAVIVVLTFSNLFISLLRKIIPNQVRIASFIVIISGFVTAVELLIKAYAPALDKSLGIFIPLIVVNCIILARAEAFASKNKPLPSVFDGITMGIGFTLALTIIASVRELLGAGTLLGFQVLGDWYSPALIFILPAGAFFTLGFLVAAVKKLTAAAEAKKVTAGGGFDDTDEPEMPEEDEEAVLNDDVELDATDNTTAPYEVLPDPIVEEKQPDTKEDETKEDER